MPKTKAPKKDWVERAVEATHGNQSKFGCIFLATIADQNRRVALRTLYGTEPHPAFASCASVTSDGYIMAGFIDRNGEGHHGAFVGSFEDFKRNVLGLADHLKLKGEEREAYLAQLRGWIKDDWRGPNKDTF